MAPPTSYYNNATNRSSHTTIELNSTSGISLTERYIANSIIGRDISIFNGMTGNSYIAGLTGGVSFIKSTSNGIPLTNLMINNQEDEIGTVFAFAAKDVPTVAGADRSFTASSGLINTSLGTNTISTVSLNDNLTNPYYDATLVFSTDNTLNTFYDNSLTGPTGSQYIVEFDNTSSNFNAEKAVNSRFNNIGSTGIAPLSDPLTIEEDTVFNTNHALLTTKYITKNTSDSRLVPSTYNITADGGTGPSLAITDVKNSSNTLYYGITMAHPYPPYATDENVFFGAIKGVQGAAGVDISGDAWVSVSTGTTTTGLVMDRNIGGTAGIASPIYINQSGYTGAENPLAAAVNDLFNVNEKQQLGPNYNLKVSVDPAGPTGAGGGYALDMGATGMSGFTGMFLDDNSLARNVVYMEKCSTEGDKFRKSSHTLEITNGYLTRTGLSNNSTQNAGLLGTPRDEIETLTDLAGPTGNYNSDFIVQTAFTEPNSNVVSSYPRSSGHTGSGSNYTNFKVVYATGPTGVSREGSVFGTVLPANRRTNYNVQYDIKTSFPATVAGGHFTGSNYIGSTGGFSTVFQTGKNGINSNTDYSFTSGYGSTGTTHSSYLNNNEVGIIQLNNALYLMSEENTLFSTLDTTNPISNTRTVVVGENIDLTNYADSIDPTKSDIRISLSNKTVGDLTTVLPTGWSWGYTNATNNLITDLSTVNIFGDNIYEMTKNTTNEIPMTISPITNGVATNYDALDLALQIGWTWNTTNYSKVIDAANFTLTQVGSTTSTKDTTPPVVAYVTGSSAPSATVKNLLDSYQVNKYTDVRTYSISSKLPLGEYSNLQINTPNFVVTSIHYVLDHKTQPGVKLSDNYLNYFRLGTPTGSKLGATRTISNDSNASFNLKASDLYGFKAHVQYLSNSSTSTWTNITTSPFHLDLANNNETIVNLTGGAKIAVAVDLSKNVTGNSVIMGNSTTGPNYFIGLTTSDLSISYTVQAKKFNPTVEADFNALAAWTNMGNDFLPDAGQVLAPLDSDFTKTGLYAVVTNTPGSNLAVQPSVSIQIKDQYGNIWATLSTTNKNATSSFNIIRNMRPLFTITETYGDSTPTILTTKKQAETTTQLAASAGIELTFNTTTINTDYQVYKLKGDYVKGILYGINYTGTYNGSFQEVTPQNGLLISQPGVCRGIDILAYRGNSVKPDMFTNGTTYEEFKWARTPTYVSMKVVNYGVTPIKTYQETPREVWVGMPYTVSNLGALGNLGLIVGHRLSRYLSTDRMSIPINLTDGKYKVVISNPIGDGTGTYLLTQSGTTYISTFDYMVLDFVPFNVVASRIKIGANSNLFTISSGLQRLKLYYSPDYIGNPVDYTWSTNFYTSYSQEELSNTGGVILPVPVYSTESNGYVSSTTDSVLNLSRASTNIEPHTFYFVLPRPQYKVTAIATNAVSSLPHNGTAKTVRYFEADYSTGSIAYPFAGVLGESSGTRVINNMSIKFNDGQTYLANRFNPSSVVHGIYIPSNILNVDLYGGAHHTSRPLNSITRLYSDNIHKIYTSNSSYVDSNSEIETFFSGTRNSNLSYNFGFTQPADIVYNNLNSSLIYGAIGTAAYNIKVNNIAPFINIPNTTYAHIDLVSGKNTTICLYGHSIKLDSSNNLVAELVRYESLPGLDLTDEGSSYATITKRNLGFYANKRYYTQKILRDNSGVTSIPYNLQQILSTIRYTEDIPSWTYDSNFVPRQLDFNLTALSTDGLDILQGLVSVSSASPYRALVCQYNPVFEFLSPDGSPIYIVNAWGTLKSLQTHTKVVSLSSNSINNGSSLSVPAELLSYNVLDGVGI